MKILFAGDLRPNRKVRECFDNSEYRVVFEEVKKVVERVDYAIVNLESPIVTRDAAPIVKTGPNLKCNANVIPALQYAGFNCVTLANNHFFDYGEIGVEDTLHLCENANIDYVGGGRNLNEAKKTLYKKIDNKIVAIINRCENEWSIATEDKGGSAPMNVIETYYAIQEAKNEADYVVLILHGGIENYRLPTPQMKNKYRFFVDAGADAIINHHQHCYSGFEIYKGKPIFYGLGNFCFFSIESDKQWQEGFLVSLDLSDNITFKLIPYIQCKNQEPTIRFDVCEEDFFNSINQLNKIIEDDSALNLEYDKLVASKKRTYLDYIEPHSSKMLFALQHRNICPYFLKKKKKKYLMNLIRCESHHDILLRILDNTISK